VEITFEGENFVPARIEVTPLDAGTHFASFLWQQHDLDVRIAGARYEVLGGKFHGPDHFQRQRRLDRVVFDVEFNPSVSV